VWVIDTTGGATFVVLDTFWDAPPSPEQLAEPLLMPQPFGQHDDLYEDVFKGWFSGELPADFAVRASVDLPPRVQRLADPSGTMVFQDAEHFRRTLHEQWRWLHDRPALEAEWAARAAKHEEQERERARKRRETVTLPRMLRERPFSSWSERWPASAVREARRIFRAATSDLIALGARSPKAKRTEILRRIVTELNALYDSEGCIETVEREELVHRIEELAALVGLDNADERLTGHRDW
jgi:hypothetical protein